MPIKKKPGENKEEFISRCIATEISAGYDKDQAVAMCYAIADDEFEKIERLNKEILEFRKWRNKPKSANVNNILYNDETKELVVKFNSGEIYTYFNVEFSLFQDLVNGAGVCRTEGENKWGSWFIGKTPSVGAALYNRLVKSSISYKKGGTLR